MLDIETVKKPATLPPVKAKLLEGKRGLIVGIANENSIAWGCAKAFRAFGAEVAVTYLNEKAKKFVAPLARELQASILLPLDTNVPGQMEAVFAAIASEWGKLDFVVHSIAFSPKEALQGRVIDVTRDYQNFDDYWDSQTPSFSPLTGAIASWFHFPTGSTVR